MSDEVKLTHPSGSVVETTEQYAAMYESQGFSRDVSPTATPSAPATTPTAAKRRTTEEE